MVTYLLLSIAFTLGLLLISVRLRKKYWVQAPFAITLSPTKTYRPKQGVLGHLGYTTSEAALLKKIFVG